MARVSYSVGDWFAVPLPDGGFAVGIVARANPKGVLLGYFFGPRRSNPPAVAELERLTSADAVLTTKLGHLGLIDARWPVLGRTQDWDPGLWPMPTFVRYEQLTGRIFEVCYDQDDPNLAVAEDQISADQALGRRADRMSGHGAVENRLAGLL
jgi:hypothetical protein